MGQIFVAEKEEAGRDWRKRHNEKLHVTYCSPSIVWVMESTKKYVVHVE
jgi:hypothetical protein